MRESIEKSKEQLIQEISQLSQTIDQLNAQIEVTNKSEEKLRESEEKFNVLTKQSLFGTVILKGSIGKYVYVNNAFSSITGYSK